MPRINDDIYDRFKRFAKAKKNYETLRQADCYICDTPLKAKDGFLLRDFFDMDRRGNFYCSCCAPSFVGLWNKFNPSEEREL